MCMEREGTVTVYAMAGAFSTWSHVDAAVDLQRVIQMMLL